MLDWQSRAVWRAVDSLSPVHRDVIRMRFFRKAPLARGEVAKALREKYGRRFRRASTIKAIEEVALRVLSEKLRALQED